MSVVAIALWLQLAQHESPNAWKEKGMKLATSGQLEAASEAFAKACQLNADEGCYFFGRALFTLGRYPEAQDAFDAALKQTPQPLRGKVHRATALNFIALTNPAEAERHFRDAIKLKRANPSEEDPRIDYGAFLFRQGRLDASLPLLEQAAQSQPPSARANMELGRVLLHMNKPEAALPRLEKAVELDPTSTAARLLLGRTYLALGRTEEGERQLKLGEQGWRKRYGSSTFK
jgi:tetratricopeptide (TPR) repeat protein